MSLCYFVEIYNMFLNRIIIFCRIVDNIFNCTLFTGHGLRLSSQGPEVFAECMSEKAIFVQSQNYNISNGYNGATVHRIAPGNVMSDFCLVCFKIVCQRSYCLSSLNAFKLACAH